MTIKEMQDAIIMSRGFEDKMTLWFFGVCEDKTMSKTAIENAFIAAMTMPFCDEEDEEI